MKKEIPILYSTAMAQAKVAWRKTQTRRIVKFRQKGWRLSFEANEPTRRDLDAFGVLDKHGNYVETEEGTPGTLRELNLCPYGEVGSILWGRECVNKGENGNFHYKTDELGPLNEVRWTPSIHMPKEAARIWDEITGIRVERVADISEEDCIAEGIEMLYNSKKEYCGFKNYLKEGEDKNTVGFGSPIKSYRSLWQLINGKPKLKGGQYEVYPFDEQAAAEFAGVTTWKGKPLTVITNPWVWVIESKQLSVNGKP